MGRTQASEAVTERPLLRGVIHQVAFSVSLVVGTLLIVGADGAKQHVAAAVFAGSVAVCFGASALYHRVIWTPPVRLWMRRIDHAGVYLLIAGTYTAVCLLGLAGAWRWTVLAVVWAGAATAIVLKFVWVGAPKWLAAAIGIGLGWIGVAAMPELASHLGAAAVILLGIGGLVYTAGGIVYARGRPDPVPHVFGYHELFHAMTIVAVACQYVAIAFFVVRVEALAADEPEHPAEMRPGSRRVREDPPDRGSERRTLGGVRTEVDPDTCDHQRLDLLRDRLRRAVVARVKRCEKLGDITVTERHRAAAEAERGLFNRSRSHARSFRRGIGKRGMPPAPAPNYAPTVTTFLASGPF